MRILLVEALFQAVYKIVVSALVLKDRVEVGPWQLVVIDQVDQHIDARLDVVPSRLAVAAARVKRCKHEVAAELVQLLLLDVLPILIQVGRCQAEIDQVEAACVCVTQDDVLELQIVVHEVLLMQHFHAFELLTESQRLFK